MEHERGVYHHDYVGPGETEVLVLVDRHGRCLARTFVPEGANRPAVVRSLQKLLYRLDPPPPLRLLE